MWPFVQRRKVFTPALLVWRAEAAMRSRISTRKGSATGCNKGRHWSAGCEIYCFIVRLSTDAIDTAAVATAAIVKGAAVVAATFSGAAATAATVSAAAATAAAVSAAAATAATVSAVAATAATVPAAAA